MNKLVAAACCLLLAGCASADALSGSADPAAIQGYASQSAVGLEASPPDEQITTTCSIKNETVTCR